MLRKLGDEYNAHESALNFVYTRCALPNFCLRSSNNFGELQKRFKNHLKTNLVLLTVTFDPVHDSPEAMAKYARRWNADPNAWHFLTGSESAIRRVCDLLAKIISPMRWIIPYTPRLSIEAGRLVANLEGNEFSAEQLGDLVATALSRVQSEYDENPTFSPIRTEARAAILGRITPQQSLHTRSKSTILSGAGPASPSVRGDRSERIQQKGDSVQRSWRYPSRVRWCSPLDSVDCRQREERFQDS